MLLPYDAIQRIAERFVVIASIMPRFSLIFEVVIHDTGLSSLTPAPLARRFSLLPGFQQRGRHAQCLLLPTHSFHFRMLIVRSLDQHNENKTRGRKQRKVLVTSNDQMSHTEMTAEEQQITQA